MKQYDSLTISCKLTSEPLPLLHLCAATYKTIEGSMGQEWPVQLITSTAVLTADDVHCCAVSCCSLLADMFLGLDVPEMSTIVVC